jgi:hypothetical protein
MSPSDNPNEVPQPDQVIYNTTPYQQTPGYVPPPPTNSLAITSLVLSCSSIIVIITAPIGIITGLIALKQIKRTGEQGKGLAMAGVIVGTFFTLIMLLFLLCWGFLFFTAIVTA